MTWLWCQMPPASREPMCWGIYIPRLPLASPGSAHPPKGTMARQPRAMVAWAKVNTPEVTHAGTLTFLLLSVSLDPHPFRQYSLGAYFMPSVCFL